MTSYRIMTQTWSPERSPIQSQDLENSAGARTAPFSSGIPRPMHPHPNPRHVLVTYRQHILSCKRKWSSARSLIHYREFVATYLWAKRAVATPNPAKGHDAR